MAKRTWKRTRLLSAGGGRFGFLLIALIALMGFAPLLVEGRAWTVLLTLFTGVVLVASLHAARPGGRPVLIGIGLALADFGIGRLAMVFETRWLLLLQLVLWLASLIYVIIHLLEWIFESEEVTVETLQASLCIYLLIGLFGTFAFALIDLAAPGSFQTVRGAAVVWTDHESRAVEFVRLFVFSYATLSGASSGDLVPANGFASNATSLEAMIGQIYLAVVIARLVGIQSAQPPS